MDAFSIIRTLALFATLLLLVNIGALVVMLLDIDRPAQPELPAAPSLETPASRPLPIKQVSFAHSPPMPAEAAQEQPEDALADVAAPQLRPSQMERRSRPLAAKSMITQAGQAVR